MGISRFRVEQRATRAVLAAVLGLLVGSSLGCSTYVPLSESRYLPEFDPAPLPNYRGRTILMRGFENADDNTTIFMYPRSGPRRYGGPALASYFWYCFRAAFARLGVRVLEEAQITPETPIMDISLVRIQEHEFTADVSILGGQGALPFQKRYTVEGPPLTVLHQTELEARAYQMVTLLFWAIVEDPQFQAVAAPVTRTD